MAKPRNKRESAGHIGLGFLAGLVNLRLLLNLREIEQLPPENRNYPVAYLRFESDRNRASVDSLGGRLITTDPAIVEYWAMPRVRDTLLDSFEYRIGETISWFFVLGAGVLLGRWLFGQ